MKQIISLRSTEKGPVERSKLKIENRENLEKVGYSKALALGRKLSFCSSRKDSRLDEYSQ